jgi:pimeloyl-ACP methyl ester carboxylesterase
MEIRYAHSGETNIAYQVVGSGPIDIVMSPGWITHLELAWDVPPLARFYRRLGAFARVILFDKRGVGLSDRVSDVELPTTEQRMDDVRAVMDAVGSERAALFGTLGGGAMSALFSATYPTRTSALVLYATAPRLSGAPERYLAHGRAERSPGSPTRVGRPTEEYLNEIEETWGGDFDLLHNAPSYAGDDTVRRAWARLTRAALSPRAARTLMAMGQRVDISQILRAIHVPTLVIHRTGDPSIEVERGRELAGAITGARFVELAGDDHYFWAGDADRILLEMQEFLTGVRPPPEEDRVLATVLFTDIVGSTHLAATMGDRAWASLLEEHRLIVRRLVAHYRGREVDTAGDGFLVTFDGPARAVRCALEACESVRSVGIELRAGLHTGEIQARGGSHRRNRGTYGSPDLLARSSERSRNVLDRKGSRRGLRSSVRGPGRARSQGAPRPLACLSGHGSMTVRPTGPGPTRDPTILYVTC